MCYVEVVLVDLSHLVHFFPGPVYQLRLTIELV